MTKVAHERVFRCKRTKPGDGGVVDGCGWQGYEGSLTVRPVSLVRCCPNCGSDCVREIRLGSDALLAPVDMVLQAWHECLISFVVSNIDRAQDINLHPEMPKRWMLLSAVRLGTSSFYKLEFEVEGIVNARDGETVKRIIAELGM